MDNIQKILPHIQGSEKLTKIFGHWPSFHDSEVVDLHLWRGNDVTGPMLTLYIHACEVTDATDDEGQIIYDKFTLTILRFHHIMDFKMDGWQHPNMLHGFSYDVEERGNGLLPYLHIEIEPHSGPIYNMGATFKCFGIEVVDAVPTTNDRPETSFITSSPALYRF